MEFAYFKPPLKGLMTPAKKNWREFFYGGMIWQQALR
jgi:hypothetical protein